MSQTRVNYEIKDVNRVELDNLPFVSIIIPTYNEAKYISLCLESLINLNYPRQRYEIIVIDNGSTDNTVFLCKELTPHVYICPGLNVSGLRNYGAKKAKGTVLAFIDGDCVADKDWILNGVKSLQSDFCITGSEVKIPKRATWVERAWFSQGKSGRCETTHINTANLIVPSDIFNQLRGFNETLITGEDYEFSMRVKKIAKVISDDTIRVTHLDNPKTLFQFFKREIWHGLGAFSSFKINFFDKPLIGTFLFSIFFLSQIIGFIYMLFNGSKNITCYSSIGILFLLCVTVFYRIKFKIFSIEGLRLILLYYFYYLGRAISLIYILSGKQYYRKKVKPKFDSHRHFIVLK